MKLILFLGLMGINLSGLAWPVTNDDQNTLNITIDNASSYLCTLKSYQLLDGEFYFGGSIPKYIPAYSSTSPILLNTCNGAELELSYTCGKDREFTINTRQNTYYFSSKVIASLVSFKNMTITHKIKTNWFHNAVQWQLEA